MFLLLDLSFLSDDALDSWLTLPDNGMLELFTKPQGHCEEIWGYRQWVCGGGGLQLLAVTDGGFVGVEDFSC